MKKEHKTKRGGANNGAVTPLSSEDPEWSQQQQEYWEEYGANGFWGGWDFAFASSSIPQWDGLCSSWQTACSAQCKNKCQVHVTRMHTYCDPLAGVMDDMYGACVWGFTNAYYECAGGGPFPGPNACDTSCGDAAFMLGFTGFCD